MMPRVIRGPHAALALVLFTLFALGAGVLGAAQSKASSGNRAAVRTVKPRRQGADGQPAERQFAFGDIMLRNWATMEGDFSEVRVSGANVTVDSVDPKAGSTTHMTARQFIATKAKGGGVGKVEAIGAMKFSGVRPAVGRKGMQTFEGSGSRGTYFKQDGRLEMEGPVAYHVEQPTATGSGKQWVRGTADRATYDEVKKLLILSGHVRAKVADPEALDEGKPGDIAVDQATLDFSTPKVTFKFTNTNPEGGELRINPKQQPKPDEKKGGS